MAKFDDPLSRACATAPSWVETTEGRWTGAALVKMPRGEIVWKNTPGRAWVACIADAEGKLRPVATLRRQMAGRESGWHGRIEGFEWRRPANRIITHVHYSQPRHFDTVDEAKRTVAAVLNGRPTIVKMDE